MLALLLIACDTPPADTGKPAAEAEIVDDSDSAVPEATSSWRVEPSLLVLGTLAIGEYEAVEVTLSNTGNTELTVDGGAVTAGTLLAVVEGGSVVPSGESATVALSVAASGTALDYTTFALHLSAADGEFDAPIQVVASGVGPLAALSVDAPDFGEVTLGCGQATTVTVTNSGNRDLTVLTLELSGDEAFTLEYPEEGATAGAPPWTLSPGEARSVGLGLLLKEYGDVAAQLTLASDDMLDPEVEVELTAAAVDTVALSDTWTVAAEDHVTGLFAVNDEVPAQYPERLFGALPTFFQALLDTGVPYRIAFVQALSGKVTGSTAYIDETLDPEAATEVARTMLTAARGDNDAQLQTLDNAIAENASWLLDEDVVWANATLNLVGINFDQEQSTGNETVYLTSYRSYKTDPTTIVVHGIGGDDPGGCPGADPYTKFADAAAATGGVFLSFCEADWTSHMERLAEGFLNDSQVAFSLTSPAIEGSVAVYVDGVEQTEGWSYDSASNAVYFDETAPPDDGAEVRAEYRLQPECDP